MRQFDHFCDLIVGQSHNALCLGDAVQIQAVFVHRLQQRLHDLGSLDAGDLKAVLSAVLEAFFGVGERISVSAGQTDRLEKLSCMFHAVHSRFPFSGKKPVTRIF